MENRADNIAASVPEGETPSAAFDGTRRSSKARRRSRRTPTRGHAIGFMPRAHYDTLLKSNALDDTLARRIFGRQRRDGCSIEARTPARALKSSL